MTDIESQNSTTLDLATLDDEEFECLVAAIFRAKILRPSVDEESSHNSYSHTVVSVSHSGRGADEGQDLMVTTWVSDCVIARQFRWLVQCKHKAKSKRSVQLGDFKNDPSFVDVVTHHRANGYLLICSTRPARNLQNRFDTLTDESGNPYHFVIWDGIKISEEAHKYPDVIRVFFPDYYRRQLQKDFDFNEVVGWFQREGISEKELSVLNTALSRVVRPEGPPEADIEPQGEPQ